MRATSPEAGGRATSPQQAGKDFGSELEIDEDYLPESMTAAREEGAPTLLLIYLVEARGLAIKDKNLFGKGGSSDPVVILRVGDEQLKSTCKKKSLAPVWKESYEIAVDDATEELRVTVEDVDLSSKNDFMGECRIPLREVRQQAATASWYPLSAKGEEAGEVQLALRWVRDERYACDVPPEMLVEEHGEANCLKCFLIRARGLPSMDRGGSSDPYASLEFNGEKLKSTVKKKTLAPRWLETFEFACDAEDLTKMKVEVMDYDVLGSNDKMGSFELDLTALSDRQLKREWHRLKQGEVEIALRWVHDPKHALELPPDFQEEEASLLHEESTLTPNVLSVFLIRGKRFKVMDSNGSSDPYVTLNIKGRGVLVKSTKKTKSLNPVWMERFELEADESTDFLECSVKDHDTLSADDDMGCCSLAVTRGSSRAWFDLGDGQRLELGLRWHHDPSRAIQLPPELLQDASDEAPNALLIFLIRGRELPVMDKNFLTKGGSSDPIVTFQVRGDASQRCVSTVKPKSLNPVWLESFTLGVDEEDSLVDCFVEDHDTVSKNDHPMGQFEIDPDPSALSRKWYPLEGGGRVEIASRWVYDPTFAHDLPDGFLEASDEPRNALAIYLIRGRTSKKIESSVSFEICGERCQSAKKHEHEQFTMETFDPAVFGEEARSCKVTTDDLTCSFELPTEPLRRWFTLSPDKSAPRRRRSSLTPLPDMKLEMAIKWYHDPSLALALPESMMKEHDLLKPPNKLLGFLIRGRGFPEPATTSMMTSMMSSRFRRNSKTEEPVKCTLALRGRGEPREITLESKNNVFMSPFEFGCEEDENALQISCKGSASLELGQLRDGNLLRTWVTLSEEQGRLELALRWVHDPSLHLELPADFDASSNEEPNQLCVYLLRGRGFPLTEEHCSFTVEEGFPEPRAVVKSGPCRGTPPLKWPVWEESLVLPCEEGSLKVCFLDQTVSIDVEDLVKRAWYGENAQIELGLRWQHDPSLVPQVPEEMLFEEAELEEPPNCLLVYLIRGRDIGQEVTIATSSDTFDSPASLKQGNPLWLEQWKAQAEGGSITLKCDDDEISIPLLSLEDRSVHRGWHEIGGGRVDIAMRWVFDQEYALPIPEPMLTEPSLLLLNKLQCFIGKSRRVNDGDTASLAVSVALHVSGARRAYFELKSKQQYWHSGVIKFAEFFEFHCEGADQSLTLTALSPEAGTGLELDLDAVLKDGRFYKRWHRIIDGVDVEIALRWTHDPALFLPEEHYHEAPAPPTLTPAPAPAPSMLTDEDNAVRVCALRFLSPLKSTTHELSVRLVRKGGEREGKPHVVVVLKQQTMLLDDLLPLWLDGTQEQGAPLEARFELRAQTARATTRARATWEHLGSLEINFSNERGWHSLLLDGELSGARLEVRVGPCFSAYVEAERSKRRFWIAAAALAELRRNPRTIESRLHGFSEKRGRLNLQGLALRRVDQFRVFKEVDPRAVKSLSLQGNLLEAWPEEFLQRLNLTSLDLSHNFLTMAAPLRGLSRLVLDHNRLTELPWSSIAEMNLSHLSASFNELRCVPSDEILQLSGLECLLLNDNAILLKDSAVASLEKLATTFLNLRKLDLRRNADFDHEDLSPVLRKLHKWVLDADPKVQAELVRNNLRIRQKVLLRSSSAQHNAESEAHTVTVQK